MERILILGAANIQIPSIISAREKGYYVISCSNNDKDPGHSYSHEYYNVDVADTSAVLALAKRLKVETVFAYASDVAIPVAVSVNKLLGHGGNSSETIELLTQKDLFKKFLRSNDFNTPNVHVVLQTETEILPDLEFPVVVKPVDSSGCRGSRLVKSKPQLQEAVNYAMTFSKVKRVLIEEYIYKQGPEVTGDGFVMGGELVFLHLGDQYDMQVNELLAYATSWPSILPKEEIDKIKNTVNNILKKAGYHFGPINIDARIGRDGNIYILEIAPRNGGNFIPQLINYATGFNSVEAGLGLMTGEEVSVEIKRSLHVALYLLHAQQAGLFSHLKFSRFLENYIIDQKMFVREGDHVGLFTNLSRAIGVLFLEFSNSEEMNRLMPEIRNHFEVHMLSKSSKERVL